MAAKLTKNPAYMCWSSMVSRCTKPTYTGYWKYGAAGITVHPAWIGAGGFQKFIEHIGPRPSPVHQIDRINSAGNYEPENVRWATPTQQNRNRKDNVSITFGGETLCMSEWAERLGVTRQSLHKRIANWGVERAISVPRKNYPKSKVAALSQHQGGTDEA